MSIRINKHVAQATNLSRRAVDKLIQDGLIKLNDKTARLGDLVNPGDQVSYNDQVLKQIPKTRVLIAMHKPVGYVCSRQGQGSKTIYDLLPEKLQDLRSIGRLDKDSSGLLLLTNDGDLNNSLGHPRFDKTKVYVVSLSKPLNPISADKIKKGEVILDGKPSSLGLRALDNSRDYWEVSINEGRNRQVRRTFSALGYTVISLKRIQFAEYKLEDLAVGNYRELAI